jgi:hypothetical protein
VDDKTKDLLTHGDHLFERRMSLLSLWQEIAEQFYPERADYTVCRSLGHEFADHLSTSYPLMVRRDLGNTFSSMLRPTGRPWFAIRTNRPETEDNQASRWLEWASGTMRRAMYDRDAQFIRATKEGDHDFAAFGQCVLSVELDRRTMTLLYRCWHLRDVAWAEGYNGAIDTVHRKWKPTIRDQVNTFRDKPRAKLHSRVTELLDKEPYRQTEYRHIVMPARDWYGSDKVRQPWVGIYLDVENQHVVEETPMWNRYYIVPRWLTVSGYQYAHSPATVIALPEARTLQAISLTLLEAGEKAANPPLIATQNAVRSDVSLFAGGITWVSEEYDERLGEVLRPVSQNYQGLPLGMEMADRAKDMLAQAFFLNKISLPPMQGEMTATEVMQRVQQYVREALPLFEPLETEYNGAICEETFDILVRGGAFGPPDDMPPQLRGADVQFQFENPLQQTEDSLKGQQFAEAKQMLALAVDLDPGAANMLRTRDALRDAWKGRGIPSIWIASEEEVAEKDEEAQAEAEAQKMMGMMGQGAAVAEQLGKAGQSLVGMQQGVTGAEGAG